MGRDRKCANYMAGRGDCLAWAAFLFAACFVFAGLQIVDDECG